MIEENPICPLCAKRKTGHEIIQTIKSITIE
jgi:hypothetical protein